MATASNNLTKNELKSIGNELTERMPWEAPEAQGLYDPQNEHEACGVGFIVAIDGVRSHKVNSFLSNLI